MPVLTGTLAKWFDGKSFGFIRPDDGGHDCFTHLRQLTNAGEAAPQEGCRVQFEATQDPYKEKPKTETWTIIGGAAPPNPGGAMMSSNMVPLGPGGCGAPCPQGGYAPVATASGHLKRWYADKGFGFIAPDDGSPDFFAHVRQLTNAHEAMQEDGARVKYATEMDTKQGKLKAQTWTVIANASGVPAPQTQAPNNMNNTQALLQQAGAAALTMGPGGVMSLNLPPPPPAAVSQFQPAVLQPPPVVPVVHKTEEVDVPEMLLAELLGHDGSALEAIKADAGGDVCIELAGAANGGTRKLNISGPEISVGLGSLLVLQRISDLV